MPVRRVLLTSMLVMVLLAGCGTAAPVLTPPPPTATPLARMTGAGGRQVPTPEMVLVEAGSLKMGSASGRADEQPVHTVRITRPFYIARYELTFDEYDRFCEDTNRRKADDEGRGRGMLPVIQVTWYDAAAYCNWLSEVEGLTPCYSGRGKNTQCDFSASGYRLPTEAEWEYAARGPCL